LSQQLTKHLTSVVTDLITDCRSHNTENSVVK